MALTPGTRLGPYEILSALGTGGMGEVYRARDPRLDRQVAIKVLPAAMAADMRARERLRREAMAVAALDHPYICKIYEIGEEGDTSAEAHTSMATFKLFYEYDWPGCEREFRRAFALNSNYAFAHDQFGLALAFQGRLDEAITEGKRAAELDPLSPQIPIDNSIALMFQGRYEAAKEQAGRAAELDPTFFFPQMVYGWADIEAGKAGDAIPSLKSAKALESPAFVTAWLAYAYGASGDRVHAFAELEDLKKMSPHREVLPFNLAIVQLGLGDRQRALDYLERAYASDSQWMGWLNKDRMFDPLRSEPRFAALRRKLQFAQ